MSKKLTTEIFIERAKKIHGDKFDYSKVNYVNSHIKVCIICPIHGEFWQNPASHLSGSVCPKCANKKKGSYHISNTKEFIEKAKQIHGEKYDYSKVEYVNATTKVCIICLEHGEFWQQPNNHLSGQRCPKCYGAIKLTTEKFIDRARKIYENKYDYSKVNYVNNEVKVCIICPEHGEFWQTPKSHLKGHECSKCANNAKKTTEQFIEEAKKIHGDKYDYSKVKYVDARTKVCIICPTHGEFWQIPDSHLRGLGCPKCAGKYKTTEDVINEFKEIHGGKYDYSKVNYTKAKEKVCIICPIHGEFWQTPTDHLNGCGCNKCANESNISEEKLYNLLVKNIGEEVIRWKKFEWLKSKSQLSLDFYIPKYNVAIEYQGVQHFKPTRWFGGEIFFERQVKNDLLKIKLCEENGIKLLHFTFTPKDAENWDRYKVYTDIKDLIKEIINE